MKDDEMIKELRGLMEEKKLSTYAVGRVLGVSAKSIQRWLNHENSPSPIYRKVLRIGIRRIKKMGLD